MNRSLPRPGAKGRLITLSRDAFGQSTERGEGFPVWVLVDRGVEAGRAEGESHPASLSHFRPP
jgi:hypothetical protein